MNFKVVINVIGALVTITGLAMGTSLLPAYLMEDSSDVMYEFGICSLSTILIGLVIFLKTRCKTKVGFREGFAVVAFGWIFVSAFGCLPYIWVADMSVTDSFFETMSGFTTTGASILTDIEAQSHALLYWRALTNWLGGMGIVVLSLAILPVLGIGGMQLYKAEVPGPTSDQITARVASAAKILWMVYLLLSVTLLLLLHLGDMPWFDAVCHTFSTMATGGFSTKNASIGYYSTYIQIVITIFMFLAGCNFVLHIKFLQGKPLDFFKDEEFRYYLYITIAVIALVSFDLQFTQKIPFKEALNAASFQVVSIISTTGFGTNDFNLWPSLAKILIFCILFVGACGGSTSGGMKISRLMLLLKYSFVQVKQCLFPHALVNVQLNGTRVQTPILQKVLSFFFLYIALYIFISVLISMICIFSGVPIDIETTLTCSIAALGNVGPGFSQVGPTQNFAWLPDMAKWVLSSAMLVGRLEIYTVIVLFLPAFWKK